jgi:hypothetical protein
MGKIKLPSGRVIKERRRSNSRIKLDIADWVKISITIFTTFAIIVLAAGKILATVNTHSCTIAEHEAKISVNDDKVSANNERIAKVESDISTMKENLIYIRGKIDTLVLKIK